MEVIISNFDRSDKKLKARVGSKAVHFGARGMSDYTKHKDPEKRYLSRHQKREDWTKSGIDSAGFYSKHVLWNKTSLSESVADLNRRYKDLQFVLDTKNWR